MNVQEALSGVQDLLSARRVFGDPIHVDEATVIPAAVVRGGGGGGAKDGEVRWRPAVDVNRIALGGQVVGIVALLTAGALIRHGRRSRGRAPLALPHPSSALTPAV